MMYRCRIVSVLNNTVLFLYFHLTKDNSIKKKKPMGFGCWEQAMLISNHSLFSWAFDTFLGRAGLSILGYLVEF